VEDAVGVFQALIAVPEKEIPDLMMKDAYAVAILPGVQKAALVVGGQYGKGVLLAKDSAGAWGSPLFITLTGGSIGWQIGVQSSDLVLFFRTRGSVDGVLKGTYTLGVDVSVAAGALGRQAGAGTDSELQAEIYTYARSRGLFAGVMLAGAKLDVDLDASSAYYGRAGVDAEEILRGGAKPGLPASAVELRSVLGRYTRSLD
jgi:lipid-binding SYLF domain-containing protein